MERLKKKESVEPEENIKEEWDDSQEVMIKIAEQVEAKYEETSGGTNDSQEVLIKIAEQVGRSRI